MQINNTSTPKIVLVSLFVTFAFASISSAQQPSSALLFVTAALEQVGKTRFYDPHYRRLAYPGGDVPIETGVCSDVVVRAFRTIGIDLQLEVHRDMQSSFEAYPKAWGLKRPDPNIDHRRVLNLMTYFKRRGKALPVSARAEDYLPGDIVAWLLSPGIYHIGIISDRKARPGEPYLAVHNIGEGARLEDILFTYKIVAHYRYF